jgi:cytochrome c5
MVASLNPRNRTPSPMSVPMKIAGALFALGALLAAPFAGSQERSGAEIVKAQCAKCHAAGTGGAPRIGDKAAWVPRLNKGVNTLVLIAIRGHGGMPPRGGKADLTDPELRAALLHMFDPAGPSKDLPKVAERPIPRFAGPHRVTTGGLDVYFGLVPGERMRDFPAGSPEARMHGGVPDGSGYHHVNVSLYDSASQAQVAGASVELDIEQLGLGREKKDLEAVTIAGGATYGTYVRLVPKGTYTFVVRVRTPGAAQAIEAKFQERLH